MKTVVVVLSLLLTCIGLGCVAVSELVTPARIDSRAKTYAIERGADANDYRAWYPNLAVSNQLLKDIRAGHLTTLQEFEQAMERENLEYGLVLDVAEMDNRSAVTREEQLFGKTGLLSLGLTMAGFGAFTGFIGLMRKRPGDVTTEEMEQAVADSQDITTVELSDKQKQFVQLIQGIGVFMAGLQQSDPVRTNLKTALSMTQDTETQVAVAAVKKELNI